MNARRILLIVAVIVIGIQFYRPAKTNPPENSAHTLDAAAQLPPEVDQILDHSCTDCHTYKTAWPWYSNVAPVSWFVISDVNDGRSHLNLSEWSAYTAEKQQRRLGEICDEVESGDMPLKQYTWMHARTTLTDAQRQAVCAWTKAEQQRITRKTGVAVPPPHKGGMQAEQKK
jgi:NADH:ubiquinone oxidoreductase subunit